MLQETSWRWEDHHGDEDQSWAEWHESWRRQWEDEQEQETLRRVPEEEVPEEEAPEEEAEQWDDVTAEVAAAEDQATAEREEIESFTKFLEEMEAAADGAT